MRIVLATDLFLPGLNGMVTSVANLAIGLRAAGHTVAMIAPNSAAATAWANKNDVALCPVPGATVPMQVLQRIGLGVFASPSVRQIVRQADVVHVHSPFVTGLAVARFAHRSGVPVVLTNHALPENLIAALRIHPTGGSGILPELIWMWMKAGIRLANLVISPSNFGARVIRDLVADASVHVVSNGVPELLGGERLLCRNSEMLECLYVGRLQREKRVEELLDGLRECWRAGLRLRLTVVGDGPDWSRLRRHAQNLGIAAHVQFTGIVSNEVRDEFYANADCLWMASRAELQCCAALEAMRHSCPVIAAHAGALPETVSHGVSGLLYEPGNCAQFRQVMEQFQCDSRVRILLARGAKRTALTHSISNTVRKIGGLYAQVLRGETGLLPSRDELEVNDVWGQPNPGGAR